MEQPRLYFASTQIEKEGGEKRGVGDGGETEEEKGGPGRKEGRNHI